MRPLLFVIGHWFATTKGVGETIPVTSRELSVVNYQFIPFYCDCLTELSVRSGVCSFLCADDTLEKPLSRIGLLIVMDTSSLKELLEKYSKFYTAYNENPDAWEAENGSWVEYEHLEKAKMLQEMGQVMSLLHQKTANETSLPTNGDLEYYSMVREVLSNLRQFLETA